jgi:asparagine synthase (glutamine-hydrolysing)
MCGILGGFWRDDPGTLEARFSSCLGDLRHRGPDDSGLWSRQVAGGGIALGHTRLSIIDLTEGGHQPMSSRDGRFTLVFNGEIYNYRELRRELAAAGHAFSTDSDTEVLLAAWAAWGKACLRRLIGMFAFAIYDRDEKTLVCARDAFGVKPLFFARKPGRFLFASELPALLKLRGEKAALNRQRAYDYLVSGVHDQERDTFVDGIFHVPAAHLARVSFEDPGAVSIERWWAPSITEKPMGFHEAAEALRALFLDSVRLHLRSDVPVGAALSGGVDSSALVCAMRHLEPDMPIHTFSFIATDERISEEKWVDIVNARVGALAHKIRVGPEDLPRDLADLIAAQGEPFGSTNIYAQYRVFREAAAHGIKVVLEGQGADELLAGYEGYGGQRMRSLLESGEVLGMRRFARNWRQWPGREGKSAWKALAGQLLPDALYAAGMRFAGIERIPAWMDADAFAAEGIKPVPNRPQRSAPGRGRRVMEVLAHSLSTDTLPTLLRYGDRNAMRFSIENRVPFLTIPLAEFLLGLPEQHLISEAGETKSVFRAAMRGIVPDEILDRRDKIGFETPMRSWMESFAPSIRENLRATRFRFLKPAVMEESFDEALRGIGWSWRVWRMVNLAWWSRLNAVD